MYFYPAWHCRHSPRCSRRVAGLPLRPLKISSTSAMCCSLAAACCKCRRAQRSAALHCKHCLRMKTFAPACSVIIWCRPPSASARRGRFESSSRRLPKERVQLDARDVLCPHARTVLDGFDGGRHHTRWRQSRSGRSRVTSAATAPRRTDSVRPTERAPARHARRTTQRRPMLDNARISARLL